MEQETILKKNDIIFSETLGVCQVAEVTNLSSKKSESILYYRLQSIFNKDKFAYIPVHGHQMKLRDIISIEEAKAIKSTENISELPELKQREIEYVLSNRK